MSGRSWEASKAASMSHCGSGCSGAARGRYRPTQVVPLLVREWRFLPEPVIPGLLSGPAALSFIRWSFEIADDHPECERPRLAAMLALSWRTALTQKKAPVERPLTTRIDTRLSDGPVQYPPEGYVRFIEAKPCLLVLACPLQLRERQVGDALRLTVGHPGKRHVRVVRRQHATAEGVGDWAVLRAVAG